MKCFYFSNGAKKEEKNPKRPESAQPLIYSTIEHVTDAASESSSSTVTPTSTFSVGRSPLSPISPQYSQKLRIFTFAELKSATSDFKRTLVIGEGGFGCVYKGTIWSSEDPNVKIDVAVKQLNKRGMQGHREWITEVKFLGVVDHPNLVKLIGYCAEDDERGVQRLLVYEYMSNKSVLDHLSPRSTKSLTWPMRLKIALDAARGLTYLHEEMEMQIIFQNFKTSNILLDEQWNAKLSDFGLAREGPSEEKIHLFTAVVGTLGYAAPECMQTGHLTVKSDIWSYGIVLYELITGRQPLDRSRPRGEQKLLEWVRPYISNIKKFPMILDQRLAGQFSLRSARQLAIVANRCLIRDPKSRPKMSEVLKVVKVIVDTAEVGSPQSPLVSFAAKQEALERRRMQQT